MGAVATRDGLLLWGNNSDSLVLWAPGESSRILDGRGLFNGVIGIAERAPGELEILDSLPRVSAARQITVGTMRATVRSTSAHGIESAAYGLGGWRAVRRNADSSFSVIAPLSDGTELFRYRSPLSTYRPRVDRAIVVEDKDHYIVALRFYPYRMFRLSRDGAIIDSLTPSIPEPPKDAKVKFDNTQLVLLGLLGTWKEPLLVLTDPFSLRRVIATQTGILSENLDARMPLAQGSAGWYAEIRAGSPTVLHRRVGGYRRAEHSQP